MGAPEALERNTSRIMEKLCKNLFLKINYLNLTIDITDEF